MSPPNKQVYTFRVERFDSQGNNLPPVTVEMRGAGFEGSLNEGDQVRIDRKPRPGKTLKARTLTNLTAGSTFRIERPPLAVRIVTAPMSLIGWIVTAAFVVGFFLILFIIISGLL